MKYKNIIDMHTHSIHSFDGNDMCDDLCKNAVSKGAIALAITDHCDIDGADIDEKVLCSKQFDDTARVKEKYKDKLLVIQGLEIGQGIYRKERTEKILRDFDYDFILGSLHNLENMDDFFFLDYREYDIYKLLQKYFEGLLELVNWGELDSLAHFTYPLRYIIAREKISVDMTKFSDIIDIIFETLIKNEKALEINTSGLFMDMRDTLPNISLVKRFKELGGKYITIGSDSHYADRVCQGIEQGMEIAQKAGFDYITIFKKRQPTLIEIK